jgi:carbonic anhydrase/acetyltransferase-like protein (isoleucine patch superfamily)
MEPIQAYRSVMPSLGARVFVHPRATVIGDAHLGDDVSVWPGVVIRGDVNFIRVGAGTNIQDNSVLHVSHRSEWDPEGGPLIIGRRVTIGHGVILHACTVGDECLIGMGSIILDKAVVEKHVLVGAGSLVAEGKRLESGYLYLGQPARAVRPLTPEEIAYFDYSAAHYIRLAGHYLEDDRALGIGP